MGSEDTCVCVGGCAYALICRTIRALSLPHTIRARGFTAEHLIDNRNWKCVCPCICVCVLPTRVSNTKPSNCPHRPGGRDQQRGGDGWMEGENKSGRNERKRVWNVPLQGERWGQSKGQGNIYIYTCIFDITSRITMYWWKSDRSKVIKVCWWRTDESQLFYMDPNHKEDVVPHIILHKTTICYFYLGFCGN